MTRFALLTGLMAILAAASPNEPTAPGAMFVGCVEADRSLFPITIAFLVPATSIECQQAALGSNATWVAMSSGICSMNNPELDKPVTFTAVDDSKCSILCIPGDETSGHCGGPQQDGSIQVFDLLKRKAA